MPQYNEPRRAVRRLDNMYGISATKLIILFAIVLVLFGGKRLPEVATSLGQAINNFRQALKGGQKNDQELLTEKNDANKSAS